MAKIKHIHCPVNGFDCPYYTDYNHHCRCTLENPMEECDDFATMWDEGDDYIDDDWESPYITDNPQFIKNVLKECFKDE